MPAVPYISEIRMFATTEVPEEFTPCDGRLLPIADNQPLYSLLGTTYGGDGKVSFALPDLSDRIPVGVSSARPPGATGGEETVALVEDHLPPHKHVVVGEDTSPGPSGNVPRATSVLSNSDPVALWGPPESLTPMDPGVIGPRGPEEPHPNVQPYLSVSFYIATAGLFPSRP